MHDFEVVSNQEIADGIFSLVISAPKLASALKPGQFVNIAVPGDASSLLRVPLSFYRADAQAGTVELWYAVVGDDTRRLSQMAPGSKSNLLGPGGRGWLVPEGTRKALLVAGGIGVPPVLCLAGMLAGQGVDVDVCLGFGTASKAVGIDEFRSLCDTVDVCTDDGSLGTHGFCTDPAAELLGEGAPLVDGGDDGNRAMRGTGTVLRRSAGRRGSEKADGSEYGNRNSCITVHDGSSIFIRFMLR